MHGLFQRLVQRSRMIRAEQKVCERVDLPPRYRPFQEGLRFSAKARGPSCWSSLP